MLFKQHFETLSVAVLTDHVARSVVVAVLRIVVSALVQKRLHHVCVASDTGDVQRGALVLRFAVQVGAELSENVDHLHVSLIASHVEGRPAIRVALIKKSISQLRVLLDQQVVARLEISLLCVDPDVAEETPLLLLILFPL